MRMKPSNLTISKIEGQLLISRGVNSQIQYFNIHEVIEIFNFIVKNFEPIPDLDHPSSVETPQKPDPLTSQHQTELEQLRLEVSELDRQMTHLSLRLAYLTGYLGERTKYKRPKR